MPTEEEGRNLINDGMELRLVLMSFLGGSNRGGGRGRRFSGVGALLCGRGRKGGDFDSPAAEVVGEEEEYEQAADDGGDEGDREEGKVCSFHR